MQSNIKNAIFYILMLFSAFQIFSCATFTRNRLLKISKNPDIPIIDPQNDQVIKIKNNNRIVSNLLTIKSSKLCIIFHASRTTIKGDEINARTLYKNGFSRLNIIY
jgi:hypothetical protein